MLDVKLLPAKFVPKLLNFQQNRHHIAGHLLADDCVITGNETEVWHQGKNSVVPMEAS